jgi:hypothetical protein
MRGLLWCGYNGVDAHDADLREGEEAARGRAYILAMAAQTAIMLPPLHFEDQNLWSLRLLFDGRFDDRVGNVRGPDVRRCAAAYQQHSGDVERLTWSMMRKD